MIRGPRSLRVAASAASLVALTTLAACSTGTTPQASGSQTATSAASSDTPTAALSPSGSASSSPHSTPSSPSTTPSGGISIATRWAATHAGGGAVAAAVGAGRLWVGYALTGGAQGKMHGELVGYGLTSGRPEVTAQVGPFPVAVAASASGVWVANGVGDGSQLSSALVNTVEQFSPAGKLVKTSRVAAPAAVAASGATAWAYYTSGQQAHVRPVTTATSGPAAHDTALPGQPEGGQPGATPLLFCGGKLFAVSAGQGSGPVTLTELSAGATQLARISATAQVPSLACASAGSPVLVLSGRSSVLASSATGYKPVSLKTAGDTAVADGGSHLWLSSDANGAATITTIDQSGGTTGSKVTMPASQTPFLAGDNSGLWVVAPSLGQGSATIHVEHLTTAG